MLSDSQIFFAGIDSTINSIHMYRYTFGNSDADWAKKITWTSAIWVTGNSESLISTDGSKIYSFFIFGHPAYLYFATFSVSSGNVINSRYKSSIYIANVQGSAQNGEYILVTVSDTSASYVLLFNIVTLEFIVRGFSTTLYGSGIEKLSGR